MDPQDTRLSLLQEARSGDTRGWQRLANLYQPLITRWARQHVPAPEDAEDLAQEILLEVFRYLPRFEHNGRPGAFRSWLRTITVHATHDFWSARRGSPRGSSDLDVQSLLEGLQDPASELSQAWDREHDQFVLNRLLEQVAVEFELPTMQAFHRLALDGATAETVSGELNMSPGAVYTAKSRVLRRLRQLSEGLLDFSGATIG